MEQGSGKQRQDGWRGDEKMEGGTCDREHADTRARQRIKERVEESEREMKGVVEMEVEAEME